MDDRDIFDEMVPIFRTYAKDRGALDVATPDTGIIADLKVNKKIFEEVLKILKPYTKDQPLPLLEKATMETSIINDLKVISSRIIDLILNF